MRGTEQQDPQPSPSQDSPSWAEALERLRADYLRGSLARLDAIAGLIARLEGRPSGAALGELRTCFHGLSGSGLTYGFPAVSLLGSRGEEACRAAIQADARPSPGDFAEWRRVLDALHRELDGRAASH